MIETPTENVKLTFEQLQQLDVVQKRLAVLESEMAIATKLLKGTRLEGDRALKEKIYQEELLATVKEKIEKAQKDLDSLVVRVAESSVVLNEKRAESEDIHIAAQQTLGVLNDREDRLAKAEKEYEQKNKELNNKIKDFLTEKSTVEEAKKAFKKAVEFVKWS